MKCQLQKALIVTTGILSLKPMTGVMSGVLSRRKLLAYGVSATYCIGTGVYASKDLYKLYPQHKVAGALFGMTTGPIFVGYAGVKQVLCGVPIDTTLFGSRAVFGIC